MAGFGRNAPPIAVVLAFLLLWVSFAWGLPAGAPVTKGEAEVAPEDPWAAVRISDAYDYAKCPNCGKKNETRAEACARCGNELPQPSAEVTDPDMVFVPGKGYYEEGALLEPGKSRKGLRITGLVLIPVGLITSVFGPFLGYTDELANVAWVFFPGGLVVMGVGFVLLLGVKKSEPVYAFASDELYERYERPAFTRRPLDTDGVGLKVEVTLLSF